MAQSALGSAVEYRSHIPDWIALAMADFCGKKLGKSFVVTFARIGLDSSKRLIQ